MLACTLWVVACTAENKVEAGLGDEPASAQQPEKSDTAHARNASTPAEETGWRSELYAEDWRPPEDAFFTEDRFLQDYSYAGYARGEKPIPRFEGAPVFNVLDYGADPHGQADSTAAIQQALDTASAIKGPAVVYMPAGTYHVAPIGDKRYALVIGSSDVVLRGDGPDKTYLLNTSTEMRGSQIILVSPQKKQAVWDYVGSPATAIAYDLLMPTTYIPVESTEGFKPGDMVIVRADPTSEWIKERKEEDGWLGYEDKIGHFMYLRRVLEVDADNSELVIDIPIRYALKVRDNAQVYAKPGLVSNVGLENFSIGNVEHPGQDGWGMLDFAAPDGAYTKRLAEGYDLDPDFAKQRKSAYDVHFSYAVVFNGVYDSWIVNVHSFEAEGNARGSHILSNGIRLKECLNVSVIDCSMGHTLYGGGGGNGYMFRIDNSNECLLENCVAESARHGFSLSGMATSGNVLLHCTDRNTATQAGGDGTTTGRSSDSHMYFSHSNLFDGCVADNSWFEARDRFYVKLSKPKHNTTSAQTVFWNTTGLSNSYHPFVVWSEQGDYGYVIGTQGEVSAVRTDGNHEHRKVVTDPVDHVEGIGEGGSLVPASLYQDQLARRLGQGQ